MKHAYEVSDIKGKDGKDLKKRDLVLVDQCMKEVRLTLWGDKATKYTTDEYASNPVIAIKGIKVGEYNGNKQINTARECSFDFNPPDVSETQVLQNWWHSEGQNGAFASTSGGIF